MVASGVKCHHADVSFVLTATQSQASTAKRKSKDWVAVVVEYAKRVVCICVADIPQKPICLTGDAQISTCRAQYHVYLAFEGVP